VYRLLFYSLQVPPKTDPDILANEGSAHFGLPGFKPGTSGRHKRPAAAFSVVFAKINYGQGAGDKVRGQHKVFMNDTDKKQEKPDLLKQMSSVTSHEIRNPLAIISNSIYFIKTKLSAGGAAVDPKIAKHIGIIEGEVKHSNAVIDEILAFTHTKELHCAPASVNSAIRDLTGAYQFPPSVTVKTIPDPADPCVNADMGTVSCALRYILDNSAQSMPEGGTVTIEASHDAGRAFLIVTDSGPGLPDGDGEKIFAPFFTTKPRGVGLGLTIARKFLEQQGGTVTAQNAAPRGARITLSLPLMPKQ